MNPSRGRRHRIVDYGLYSPVVIRSWPEIADIDNNDEDDEEEEEEEEKEEEN